MDLTKRVNFVKKELLVVIFYGLYKDKLNKEDDDTFDVKRIVKT